MGKRTSKQAISQRLGAAFEASVESNRPPWGVFFKVPTSRNRRGVEDSRVWLDYVACEPEYGRFVTFDSKWVGEDTRIVRSRLSAHQQAWAEAALLDGGIVFVLVGNAVGGQVRRYVVPWEQLRDGGVDLVAELEAPEGRWWEVLP